MRVCIVYYSRTGNTEYIVEVLRRALIDSSISVDVYRAIPVKEYSRPLHLNPRVLFDTLVRKGTEIKFISREPLIEQCSIVVAASPIWMGTLAPPMQEFLKKYIVSIKHLIIITTSAVAINSRRIEERVEKLYSLKPILCLNIHSSVLKDKAKIDSVISTVIGKLKDILIR